MGIPGGSSGWITPWLLFYSNRGVKIEFFHTFLRDGVRGLGVGEVPKSVGALINPVYSWITCQEESRMPLGGHDEEDEAWIFKRERQRKLLVGGNDENKENHPNDIRIIPTSH
jgi:hypothetical protein